LRKAATPSTASTLHSTSNNPCNTVAAAPRSTQCTFVDVIAHGPVRVADRQVDADWMIDALQGLAAGDHIRALLTSA
jgi:hypothetical protein